MISSFHRTILEAVCVLMAFAASCPAAPRIGEGVPLDVEGRFASAIWAPDGKGMALAGEGFTGLYYADSSGQITTISDAPLAGWGFCWSPDGESLAYRVRSGDDMGMALMVARRGQQGSEQLTPYLNDMFPPRWGKDGLTFRSGDELVTMDGNGDVTRIHSLSQGRGILSRIMSVGLEMMVGGLTGATYTGYACTLATQAADGQAGSGVFMGPDSQAWIVDEMGNRRKLIDVEGEEGYCTPVESPGGGKYAVAGYSGELYVVNPATDQVSSLGKGGNARWSPDGQHLIYEVTTDNGHDVTSSELWISNADGSERYPVTDTPGTVEQNASWSPDGSWISYVVDGQVYVAPVE